MQTARKKQLWLLCVRSAVFCFSFMVFFLTTTALSGQAYASADQIGTHVAYGDTGEQIKVINFVKSKSPPANYPITIMVNIGASAAEVQEIADALNAGSFSVNVRILGITTSTRLDTVQGLAVQLNHVNWKQGKKPIVVFGNELNAYKGNEWGSTQPGSLQQAATIYAPLLDALTVSIDHGKYDLSGVALDPYHSDLATSFIDYARSAFSNPGVTAFSTNVYDGVSNSDVNGVRANLDAGLKLYDHLAAFAPKSRKVFTEFGLNPQIRDVTKQLAFYKQYDSQPIPGGFEYATALVPNLCSASPKSGNEWYFYILGKIYDQNLQEVTTACKTQANNENGTFIYPGPVDVWNNTGGDIIQRSKIFQAVISHDYLLTCSPQIQFKASVAPSDPQVILNPATPKGVESLLSHCDTAKNGDPNCIFNVGDESVSVIADNASIPFIRSSGTGRTSSFEGFFTTDLEGLSGAGSVAGSGDSQSLLLYSPASKLTSRLVQCQQNMQFLNAVDTTCTKIPPNQEGVLTPEQKGLQHTYDSANHINTNPCGLDTTVNNVKLREIMKEVRDQGFTGHEADYCDSDAFKSTDPKQTALASLVMQVQPVTPDAYRIGYIIIYISGQPGDLSANDMITKIVRPMEPGYLKNIFKIVPVLVPANFGTQTSDIVRDARGTTVLGGSFDGAFKRTISPLLPSALVASTEAKALVDQNAVRDRMTELAGKTENSPDAVYLPYCKNPLDYSASGLSDTDAALNCWMADYINANLDIGSGNIIQQNNQMGPCKFLQEDTGGETAHVLNSPLHPMWDTSPLETNLQTPPTVNINGQIVASHAQSGKLIDQNESKIRVFFAVPNAEFGLIKNYEQYLFQSLVGREMFKQILASTKEKENKNTNGYLRMIDVELLQKGATSKNFKTRYYDDDGNLLVPPQSTDVTAQFEVGGDANPVLWGGWLSKFVYSYTANVTSKVGEKAYSPFDLANRLLEPYWLGNETPNTPPPGSPPVGEVSCIHIYVNTDTAKAHAAQLMADLPKQKQTWANYFSGYLANPVRSCKDGVNPDPALYGLKATQYLFETIPECHNEPCYQYIIEQTLAHPLSDGRVIDPYITISIALNENGGLKTARLDKFGQHFGVITPTQGRSKECSDDIVYMGGIDEKLQQMLGTLVGYYNNSNLSDTDALKRYGYTDGGSAMVRITNILSNGDYTKQLQCQE